MAKKSESTSPLSAVKGQQLVFGGDLNLVSPSPLGTHRAPVGAHWPAWVEQALAMLRGALSNLKVDLDALFDSAKEKGDEVLHELIEMVENSQPSWQRYIVLGALKWLEAHVHGENIAKALRG